MCTYTYFCIQVVKMSELISTRVSKEVEEDINKLAKERNIEKTLMLREVIIKGLADLKLDYALDLYKKGKITMWKAADMAEISLWEIMEIVKQEHIPSKYTLEDAKEDLRQVFAK